MSGQRRALESCRKWLIASRCCRQRFFARNRLYGWGGARRMREHPRSWGQELLAGVHGTAPFASAIRRGRGWTCAVHPGIRHHDARKRCRTRMVRLRTKSRCLGTLPHAAVRLFLWRSGAMPSGGRVRMPGNEVLYLILLAMDHELYRTVTWMAGEPWSARCCAAAQWLTPQERQGRLS